MRSIAIGLSLAGALSIMPVSASVIYNNLTPNNAMAMASRPGAGTFEIETGDDFVVGGTATVNSAAFTGLIFNPTGGSVSVTNLVVEIYRVFPLDSNSPPSGNVLTRASSFVV